MELIHPNNIKGDRLTYAWCSADNFEKIGREWLGSKAYIK